MKNRNFSIGDALRFSWSITKNHIAYFLSVMIILFVVTAVFGYVEEILGQSWLSSIVSVLNWLVQIILGLIMTKIVLEFLDGNDKPLWNDISKSFDVFWRYLGGTVLTSIIVIIGFMLFIIPGIYFAIRFQFVSYLIVDKGLLPLDALKESSEMTKGIKIDLFLLLLSLFFINFIGILLFIVTQFIIGPVIGVVLLLISLLITVPITIVALGYVYRKILGQTPIMPTKSVATIGDAVPVHPGEDLLTTSNEKDLLK